MKKGTVQFQVHVQMLLHVRKGVGDGGRTKNKMKRRKKVRQNMKKKSMYCACNRVIALWGGEWVPGITKNRERI